MDCLKTTPQTKMVRGMVGWSGGGGKGGRMDGWTGGWYVAKLKDLK